MGMKFTPDQQKVIDLRDCNILVSAAAGSGKTAVLVERIVGLVCDPERNIDIDRLLVVTFTKAAAAQMRERLTQALLLRAEAEPENEHLQRQMTLVYNAQITTIDSFCLYLIKNHFHEIGLDPDFRTADDAEQKLLAQDVLKELLEEEFAKKDPAFLNCVECFAYGGKEKRLEELIVQLYEFAMSYPWPEEWLKAHRGDFRFCGQKAEERQDAQTADGGCTDKDTQTADGGRASFPVRELESQPWFGVMEDTIGGTLAECREQTEEALVLCRTPDGPYMYIPALESDLEQVEALCRAGRMQELYERLSALSFARLAVKKDENVSEEKRELVKKGRERVKSLLGGLKEDYFYTEPGNWLMGMEKAAPALEALVDLTLSFKEKFDAKKREKNLLDFADMEHMALQILVRKKEDGSTEATDTARELQSHFQEILIDEYQDSNLVQEFLMQSISGEENGRYDRFMVGDVKQSIYKFRLARPELFLEKLETYQNAQNAVRVDLKQNFRSRREVTDCVNDMFCQVMHRQVGGVEYDSDAALYPAALFPDGEPFGSADVETKGGAGAGGRAPLASGYEPEFLVAASDGKEDRTQEAYMVAHKIRSLVGTLPVMDSETGRLRPAQYRDIVILLRTTSGWDEEFRKVLEECGIPVHVTSKTGYFAATEVQTVLNFLKILNNPLQDIPLFGVLHSDIGGFSDEEIALLRAADDTGKRKLYDCLKLCAQQETGKEAAVAASETASEGGADGQGRAAAASEMVSEGEAAAALGLAHKCADFLAFLQRFREYAVYLPIHSLMERFLEETGYLYTVSAMAGGEQRRINVEMLLSRAESFEKTSYTGLFHFIRYIGQMEKYDIDYGEAGALDENADVVRIMSIHKSKGLEFPICIVAGLSKRFNRRDASAPVIMDMDLGLAIDCIDPVARTKQVTLKKNVMAQKLLTDSMGEELRVLYVAMTRAKEKLILCASCRPEKAPSGGAATNATSPVPVSPVRLLEASSFYDILLPAWQAVGRSVQVIDADTFFAEEFKQTAQAQNARQRLLQSESQTLPDTQEYRSLKQRIQSVYPHENLAGLFVKTTVSELKKAGMQEQEEASAELFAEEEVIPYLPRFVRQEEEEISGTVRGSAYHRLLELFPYEKKGAASGWTLEDIREVILQKQQSGELTEEYASAINPHKIFAFLKTPLAERMRQANENRTLKREQPFVLGIGADRLQSGLPAEETVLIQGIIDAFFEENGRLVVVDYKTDAVKEAKELVRRYQVQLDYYTQALERLTGKKVKEKIIYSFALGQEIEVP